MSDARFLYFDLGNVLLHFDHGQMCRQLADLANVAAERVYRLFFDEGLMHHIEIGEIRQEEAHRRFCEATQSKSQLAEFLHAASSIFSLNLEMVPVVTQLVAARQPIGLLSNTSQVHWDYIRDGRYGMIPALFDVCALSYEVHAVKPEPAIFTAAAKLAGYEPNKIFFVDDSPGHVAAARQVGFEAVVYTDVPRFVADLRSHGFRFNY